MDYKEFAQKVKAKYPDYADMSDEELATKMVAKFPDDYSDVVLPRAKQPSEPEPQQAPGIMGQIGQRAQQAIGGMAAPFSGAFEAGKAVGQTEQAPAAMAALGAGALTGGMGFLPAAATIGTAAAGGEAYRQIASGGEDTSAEAAQKIGTRGLESALMELGVRGGTSIIKNLGPTAIGFFQRVPSEAIKRTIARFSDMNPGLRGGMGDLKTVETIGAQAVRDSQKALEVARANAGIEVESALKQFNSAVGGKKVVNLNPVRDALNAVLSEGQLSDEAVSAAISQKEISRLQKISEAIGRDPIKTPEEAVALRRAIDDLTAFKRGGALPVQSGIGQRAAREMGAAMRQSISEAAQANNFTKLAEANSRFSNIAKMYDEFGPTLATRGRGDIQVVEKLDKIGKLYFKGGLRQDVLERMAASIPGGEKAVNTMLDAASLRAMSVEAANSPSNITLNIIRFLGSPKVVGAGIRGAYTIQPAAAPTAQAAMSAADAAYRKIKEKKK